MAKPRTPNQKKRYAALNKRLAKYVSLVQSIYDELGLEAANIVTSATDYDGTKPFRFKDYPVTKARVDDLMQYFSQDMQALIFSGTSEEWKQSNLVQDLLANDVLKTYRIRRDGEDVVQYYQPNNDALRAFQMRKDKGLTVSQKIWNQQDNFKEELETAISSAIEKGQGAITLSKRISKYLHDFPSLQTDYKERFGTATDCKDCEYRSIRLARSEINMAYRTAEQTRWQQMDFIKGYEIKLSHSHPRHDMCDDLAGIYPKWFKWTGWHPNCYSEDSEVLTDKGWKLFKDVEIDNLVLSLNPTTRKLEWVDILDMQCYEHKGEMVHFYNKSLDCLVTPDHQMVYINKSNGVLKKCAASEYRKGKGGFYRGCEYEAKEVDTITIADKQYDFDTFCEFMAYYLSDGSLQHNSGICIAQKDGQPCKEDIANCIRRMGYEPKNYGDALYFFNSKLNAYLKQFGKACDKFVPVEIKNASKRQIKVFLDAYSKCDGYTRCRTEARFKGNHGQLFTQKNEERMYFSISEKMVRDLSELILKVGHRPSFRKTEPNISHTSRGRLIKANYPCWIINECYSTTATVFDKEIVLYDGFVYDLTLERNHIMYIRRNGKCFWGSNCMCYVVPIVMTDDEWYSGKGQEIQTFPPNFKQWLSDNEKRIITASQKGTLPYWIKDNKDILSYSSSAYSSSEVLSPTKIEDLSKIDAILRTIVEKEPELFNRGYVGLKAVSRKKNYMDTDLKGNININFATNPQGFNPGRELVSAFDKIEKGLKLTEHEEYAIETLWHEILHNSSANTEILPDIDSIHGFKRVSVEAVNQLYARHTYPRFLEMLEAKAEHQDWILKNGYGCSVPVKNLRSLLEHSKIDETDFLSKASVHLMTTYKDFDLRIDELLMSYYKGKGDIAWVFHSIELGDFDDRLKSL